MKLEIPSTFHKPDNEDAGPQIEQACDWIEAEALFFSSPVTRTEAGDLLEESGLLGKSDSRAFAEEVWARLRERIRQTDGNSPFRLERQTLSSRVGAFSDSAAYAFCLLVSYAHHHKKWAQSCRFDYNGQGANFEDLVSPALAQMFPGWTVHQTGWGRDRTRGGRKVIQDVADRLCGEAGDITRWTNSQVKEAQLDLLCYREFPDKRGNFPAFFVQCASGADLPNKLQEPNLQTWNKLVALVPSSLPRRAVATPEVLSRRRFDHYANSTSGLLIDRLRLAAAGPESKWISAETKKNLNKWLLPYVKKLPRAA
jgi:hypothetical protein